MALTGERSPSPETKEEETTQHDADPQDSFACIKCLREMENGRSRKKSKVTKTALDPITLTEGDLHDIGDTVRDVTPEVL